MVVISFVVSFLLALALSYGVSKLCKDAVEAIANHFLAKNISAGAARYLQLAIVLVGVPSGTRVRLLEDYISASAYYKPELAAQLTPELWAHRAVPHGRGYPSGSRVVAGCLRAHRHVRGDSDPPVEHDLAACRP